MKLKFGGEIEVWGLLGLGINSTRMMAEHQVEKTSLSRDQNTQCIEGR